jgi:hypothetical protein
VDFGRPNRLAAGARPLILRGRARSFTGAAEVEAGSIERAILWRPRRDRVLDSLFWRVRAVRSLHVAVRMRCGDGWRRTSRGGVAHDVRKDR